MTVMPTYCNKYLTKAHEWQQLLGYAQRGNQEKVTLQITDRMVGIHLRAWELYQAWHVTREFDLAEQQGMCWGKNLEMQAEER